MWNKLSKLILACVHIQVSDSSLMHAWRETDMEPAFHIVIKSTKVDEP